MKLKKRGAPTLKIEVTQISSRGVWILVKGNEYFLSSEDFPWFRNATLSQAQQVRLIGESHLHWPDLDVDLELDSLNDLERYPLIYQWFCILISTGSLGIYCRTRKMSFPQTRESSVPSNRPPLSRGVTMCLTAWSRLLQQTPGGHEKGTAPNGASFSENWLFMPPKAGSFKVNTPSPSGFGIGFFLKEVPFGAVPDLPASPYFSLNRAFFQGLIS